MIYVYAVFYTITMEILSFKQSQGQAALFIMSHWPDIDIFPNFLTKNWLSVSVSDGSELSPKVG